MDFHITFIFTIHLASVNASIVRLVHLITLFICSSSCKAFYSICLRCQSLKLGNMIGWWKTLNFYWHWQCFIAKIQLAATTVYLPGSLGRLFLVFVVIPTEPRFLDSHIACIFTIYFTRINAYIFKLAQLIVLYIFTSSCTACYMICRRCQSSKFSNILSQWKTLKVHWHWRCFIARMQSTATMVSLILTPLVLQ